MYTEYPYTLRRSKQSKSIRIRVQNGQLKVSAPQRMAMRDIDEFLTKSADWIRVHMQKQQQELKSLPAAEVLTPAQMETIRENARRVITERVAYYAPRMGVTYGRISIRFQKSRWGSCSSKGNLNFNALLLLAPPQVLDSVVVHELAHRREMNHSPRFYAVVRQVMPEYDAYHRWLKEYGGALLRRVPRDEG